jgi:hypothetical protein
MEQKCFERCRRGGWIAERTKQVVQNDERVRHCKMGVEHSQYRTPALLFPVPVAEEERSVNRELASDTERSRHHWVAETVDGNMPTG